MTRLNLWPVDRLTDQHALAEARELPRVFGAVLLALAAGRSLDGPPRYTMGTGHVRFFYTRTDFLSARQSALIAELLSRGYNLTHPTEAAALVAALEAA